MLQREGNLGSSRKRLSVSLVLLVASGTLLSGCTAVPRRSAPQIVSRPEVPPHFVDAVLPPHMKEVDFGLYACDRGYVLVDGHCLTDAEVPHGPVVIVSDLPSAGEGAPGTCPSGGCYRSGPRSVPYYYAGGSGLSWGDAFPFGRVKLGRGFHQAGRGHHWRGGSSRSPMRRATGRGHRWHRA